MKARTQTKIRYLTMPNHNTTIKSHIVRQITTSKNLKFKRLDGTPQQPRGACSITDTPRLIQPSLAYQSIYRRRQPTL